MEDRFAKDFDLSFDKQLLVDYEIEFEMKLIVFLMILKKKIIFFIQK